MEVWFVDDDNTINHYAIDYLWKIYMIMINWWDYDKSCHWLFMMILLYELMMSFAWWTGKVITKKEKTYFDIIDYVSGNFHQNSPPVVCKRKVTLFRWFSHKLSKNQWFFQWSNRLQWSNPPAQAASLKTFIPAVRSFFSREPDQVPCRKIRGCSQKQQKCWGWHHIIQV